ncbi:MAG: efflux RND transporter periplasmic adaptor subunit [Burkholderiaceae bacterium]|nr:efflux RND transporter periplasmic adaptor subunit [Burkholderiaceae bacterium]
MNATSSSNSSRFPVKPIVAAAIVLGLAWVGYHFLWGKPGGKAPEQPPATASGFRPTKGQLESLKIRSVESMAFHGEQVTDGTIASNDDATTPVFSPYSGHVTKLYAKIGDKLEKGAPLFALDASEFVQGQNDMIAAVSTLSAAQAQAKVAEAAEKRQHELYLAKGGAMKDWLQSQADLATAQGNLHSAEAALAATRNRMRILGKSDEEIAALEAAGPAQKANPEAVVRAPIAGTVIARQVGLGQNIESAASGAANPVYTIANLSTVWLMANVREADAPLMKAGAPVEVTVSAWPGRLFKARLTWVAPTVDPNTHRLPVRAEIDNRDGALKPSMFASFRIATGDASNAPGVPESGIVREGDEARVFVLNADGTIALRKIVTGRTSGDMVEAVSGLKAGEKVVTAGALFIDRAVESN